VANTTAATAATQAIMRRMNFSWAAIREGDGAASIVRKYYYIQVSYVKFLMFYWR
jgi:hypothetical protein